MCVRQVFRRWRWRWWWNDCARLLIYHLLWSDSKASLSAQFWPNAETQVSINQRHLAVIVGYAWSKCEWVMHWFEHCANISAHLMKYSLVCTFSSHRLSSSSPKRERSIQSARMLWYELTQSEGFLRSAELSSAISFNSNDRFVILFDTINSATRSRSHYTTGYHWFHFLMVSCHVLRFVYSFVRFGHFPITLINLFVRAFFVLSSFCFLHSSPGEWNWNRISSFFPSTSRSLSRRS